MTAFPAPAAGEVEPFLPAIKTAFEADFRPRAKLLRLGSASRVWQVTYSNAGVPTSRTAFVHFGFQIADKCYYQPRVVVQQADATGWGGFELPDWHVVPRTNKHFLNSEKEGLLAPPLEQLPIPGENNSTAVVPVDCTVIDKTGRAWPPCSPHNGAGNVCEEPE